MNAVPPGPVNSELFRREKSEERIRSLTDMASFGRIGTPRNIADIVALLASGGAGWISGQNPCVNGGFIA